MAFDPNGLTYAGSDGNFYSNFARFRVWKYSTSDSKAAVTGSQSYFLLSFIGYGDLVIVYASDTTFLGVRRTDGLVSSITDI